MKAKKKREYVRNIIANAAATDISSDSVVKLFIEWINNYSELHFDVISCIFRNSQGISRGKIWNDVGQRSVREDSSDADLYKLLIRDLSTGGIIRQSRETDYYGNYIKEKTKKRSTANTFSSNIQESAFDTEKLYVLTALGKDFIHYAMTDLPIKIEFQY